MSTDSPLFTDQSATPQPPKRTRQRTKKNVVLPDEPLVLPQELGMAVDYHAYMSKHSGQKLTFEEVVQAAIIYYVELQAKSGVQLPPTMAEGITKFKATHPSFAAKSK